MRKPPPEPPLIHWWLIALQKVVEAMDKTFTVIRAYGKPGEIVGGSIEVRVGGRLAPTTTGAEKQMTIQVKVGQKGKAILKPVDAQGKATTKYDEAQGVEWTSTIPDAGMVTDEDAIPLDAEFEFKRATVEGEVLTFSAILDGDVDAGEERLVEFRTDTIEVTEPEPGEVVGGTVDLEFNPV